MWMDPPEPVVDPVCGRTLAPGEPRATVTFRGRRYYFCGDAELDCRLAFKRAPWDWADARPDAGLPIRPVVSPATRPPSPFTVARGPQDFDNPSEGVERSFGDPPQEATTWLTLKEPATSSDK